ncbi:MAG: Uma2 family endonuclease [Anaerolineae bacterium]|nr:Uma2 family endonuclease [Anaerolineae bacterium]
MVSGEGVGMVDTRVKPKLTGDDLAKLPTGMGKRYELIEGELITLSPTGGQHGFVTIRAALIFGAYNDQHNFGTLFGAETGFYTRGNKRTVRAPDASLVSFGRLAADAVPEGYISAVPELVLEVVSPTDHKAEVEAKVKEWLNFGVSMVLAAYPKTEQIHVYKSGEPVKTLKADDILDGGDILPGFSVPVRAFFKR